VARALVRQGFRPNRLDRRPTPTSQQPEGHVLSPLTTGPSVLTRANASALPAEFNDRHNPKVGNRTEEAPSGTPERASELGFRQVGGGGGICALTATLAL
jgi:hypothetical protein